MTYHKLILMTSIASSAMLGTHALGAMVTFDLTGSITIDDSVGVVSAGGFYIGGFAGSAFSDFTITIANAISNNGTFTSASGAIDGVVWDTTGPLDFGSDLVGQSEFEDFNFFASAPNGPAGVAPLLFLTGGTTGGDGLVLTSMVAQDVTVVPLPTAAWAGLGLLGAMGVVRQVGRTQR
jgi:hypothetical protein